MAQIPKLKSKIFQNIDLRIDICPITRPNTADRTFREFKSTEPERPEI